MGHLGYAWGVAVVTVVVGLNILVSLLGFYTAWRLWCWRKILAEVADAIADWQQQAHAALKPDAAPTRLLQGQQQTARWRGRYRQSQLRLRQLQQLGSLINLLSLSLRLLRRRPRGRSSFGQKRRSFRQY